MEPPEKSVSRCDRPPKAVESRRLRSARRFGFSSRLPVSLPFWLSPTNETYRAAGCSSGLASSSSRDVTSCSVVSRAQKGCMPCCGMTAEPGVGRRRRPCGEHGGRRATHTLEHLFLSGEFPERATCCPGSRSSRSRSARTARRIQSTRNCGTSWRTSRPSSRRATRLVTGTRARRRSTSTNGTIWCECSWTALALRQRWVRRRIGWRSSSSLA